jgi:hypothetical protein
MLLGMRHPTIIQVTPHTAPQIVSGQVFTATMPVTTGKQIGRVLATNLPTAFLFTLGNSNGYWAIDNTGMISVTAAGQAGLVAGDTFPKVAAANSMGQGPDGTIEILLTPAAMVASAKAAQPRKGK